MFHSSLAEALYAQAIAIRKHTGVARVGLSGGVFQNRALTEQVHALLTAGGFEVLIPERLPVNDAAISYGQLVEVTAVQAAKSGHELYDART
jgi:hydrogenase maturation protein HypF